ncbi:MAG: hypothetical protein Q9187_006660 [Circinaria calcarea]
MVGGICPMCDVRIQELIFGFDHISSGRRGTFLLEQSSYTKVEQPIASYRDRLTFIAFCIFVGLLIPRIMNNVRSKQQPSWSSPEDTEIQYDWNRPRIDPEGRAGWTALDTIIFNNQRFLTALDTGATYLAAVDASLVPPNYPLIKLLHPLAVGGIGGFSRLVTHLVRMPITLPDGKQLVVLAHVQHNFFPGVLLGVHSLRTIGANMDIGNNIVTMAGNSYQMVYINGFHPVNGFYPVNSEMWEEPVMDDFTDVMIVEPQNSTFPLFKQH